MGILKSGKKNKPITHPCHFLASPQVASVNPPPATTTKGSAAYQPNAQTSLANQVREGDQQQQQRRREQPSPPPRSSSLFLLLRRRATEPLPPSHRERYMQRPGVAHTRYTHGFSQRERQSGYIFGFTQGNDDLYDGYEPRFVPHSQTLGSLYAPVGANLNRESYHYDERHPALDNAHTVAFRDAQGNTRRHLRSRTPDAYLAQDGRHSPSYTDNIRAMAGQMYGDPRAHCRAPGSRNTRRATDAYIDAHSHNYAHDRAFTRHHHLRLSGGL